MVKKFILQWHLSEVCNLKCLHCYQENHKPIALPYSELLNILDQYRNLLKKLKVKGHINLTGGEPLCSPHFFKILDEFKKDKDLYSFSILTNGTLITDEIAKKISEYNPEYVQVSLEGGKKTNDYIRGKNVYKKVATAIKCLKKYNIFVSISSRAFLSIFESVNFLSLGYADMLYTIFFMTIPIILSNMNDIQKGGKGYVCK